LQSPTVVGSETFPGGKSSGDSVREAQTPPVKEKK
jgi:hypothetical protein